MVCDTQRITFGWYKRCAACEYTVMCGWMGNENINI